jgi:hypothetical protein
MSHPSDSVASLAADHTTCPQVEARRVSNGGLKRPPQLNIPSAAQQQPQPHPPADKKPISSTDGYMGPMTNPNLVTPNPFLSPDGGAGPSAGIITPGVGSRESVLSPSRVHMGMGTTMPNMREPQANAGGLGLGLGVKVSGRKGGALASGRRGPSSSLTCGVWSWSWSWS